MTITEDSKRPTERRTDDRRPDLGVLVGGFIAAAFWSSCLAVAGNVSGVFAVWLVYAMVIAIWFGGRR